MTPPIHPKVKTTNLKSVSYYWGGKCNLQTLYKLNTLPGFTLTPIWLGVALRQFAHPNDNWHGASCCACGCCPLFSLLPLACLPSGHRDSGGTVGNSREKRWEIHACHHPLLSSGYNGRDGKKGGCEEGTGVSSTFLKLLFAQEGLVLLSKGEIIKKIWDKHTCVVLSLKYASTLPGKCCWFC